MSELTVEARLTYAVVTAVRDEEVALPRLASALHAQTQAFERWVIVDTGSRDRTRELAEALAHQDARVSICNCVGVPAWSRGGTISRALSLGIEQLLSAPPVVVVIADADVSFESDFVEQLMARFAGETRLGIASGMCLEQRRGRWRAQPVTAANVQAPCRAYRWLCLRDLLPLEDNMAWDTSDVVEASLAGWTTRAFGEPGFRHHRPVGARERSRFTAAARAGEAAYYLGYRPSYLILRVLFRAWRDPGSIGQLAGYLRAWQQGAPRARTQVRAFVREGQRARRLPLRLREAIGRR